MTVERIDEETPLLTNTTNKTKTCNVHERRKRAPTPLPKVQISILMLLQICEPITSQSIYPYINQVRGSYLQLVVLLTVVIIAYQRARYHWRG